MGGAQLLLISFATTRLYGICSGSINGMVDGGGGVHTPAPQPWDRGFVPPTHPKFPCFLFGTERGHKSVLFSVTRLQEI